MRIKRNTYIEFTVHYTIFFCTCSVRCCRSIRHCSIYRWMDAWFECGVAGFLTFISECWCAFDVRMYVCCGKLPSRCLTVSSAANVWVAIWRATLRQRENCFRSFPLRLSYSLSRSAPQSHWEKFYIIPIRNTGRRSYWSCSKGLFSCVQHSVANWRRKKPIYYQSRAHDNYTIIRIAQKNEKLSSNIKIISVLIIPPFEIL